MPLALVSFRPAPAPVPRPPSARCTADAPVRSRATGNVGQARHSVPRRCEKHAVLSIKPDSPPAVLNVLFDDALFPARSDGAEVRIEQVVRAHYGKPGIDRTAFAFVDLVDSRFMLS